MAQLERVVGGEHHDALAVGRGHPDAEAVRLVAPREQRLARAGREIPARQRALGLDEGVVTVDDEVLHLAPVLAEHAPAGQRADRPHADAAVEAGGDHVLLVGGEPRAIDVVVVAAQDLRRAIRDTPHARAAVVARGEQGAAIARELGGVDGVGVAA